MFYHLAYQTTNQLIINEGIFPNYPSLSAKKVGRMNDILPIFLTDNQVFSTETQGVTQRAGDLNPAKNRKIYRVTSGDIGWICFTKIGMW